MQLIFADGVWTAEKAPYASLLLAFLHLEGTRLDVVIHFCRFCSVCLAFILLQSRPESRTSKHYLWLIININSSTRIDYSSIIVSSW